MMLPYMSLSLSITQQNARIGLETQRGQLSIQQPQAVVELSQPAATMEIDQGPGQITIDGTEAHSALGHKPTLRMMSDIAQQVRQIVLDTIGDIAAEGDQLMRIEKGVTISDIARQRLDAGPMPIEDTGPFTSNGVDVEYTPHPTHIEWNVHPDAGVQVQINAPQISYTPGSVRVYLEQRNSLQIDVKGKYLNMEF